MYLITDKIAAIKDVQRLLCVNITGRFDTNTRKAVIAHQVKHNIPESGIVDYETFSSILFEYRNNTVIESLRHHELNRFPYSIGMYGDDVDKLNRDLSIVLSKYSNEGLSPRGAIFNSTTLDSVRALREIFVFPEGDFVDEVLYARIIREKYSNL